MFRKISALILALVIAVSLCACGGDSEEVIIMPINEDPMCLDPQVAETDEAKLLITNCFEGLVRLDKDYKIVPGVAESWDVSTDGLTYTFHLRKDTHWKLLNSFEDILPEDYKDTYRTQVSGVPSIPQLSQTTLKSFSQSKMRPQYIQARLRLLPSEFRHGTIKRSS